MDLSKAWAIGINDNIAQSKSWYHWYTDRYRASDNGQAHSKYRHVFGLV